ncbi:MAG: LLM class flavin-dependent oxidoreductase, partial [Acidimicrobiia bacterium]|nr:LLM class flavin-dependent oxidoreductase [Acidimicrobiia bacterium]
YSPVDAGTVLLETIEILRLLWGGEQVSWQGRSFVLDSAQLHVPAGDIPIFVAARGERLLEAAGRLADGIVLMAKADLADALAVVDEAAGDRPFTRVYLDRLAFTDSMLEEAKTLYTYAVLDSPDRMLANLGLDDLAIKRLRNAVAAGGPSAAVPLITDDMVAAYQISGPPERCRSELEALMESHHMDMFMMNVISPGFDANVEMLTEVRSIVRP